jgi:hypothetical protein
MEKKNVTLEISETKSGKFKIDKETIEEQINEEMFKRNVVKCVSIKNDQNEFIKNEKNFNLSKFLQWHLDKYIGMREQSRRLKDINGK